MPGAFFVSLSVFGAVRLRSWRRPQSVCSKRRVRHGPGHDLDPRSKSRQKIPLFGEKTMARVFALLMLVAAVTAAAAGERFPILQPDQMNFGQKKLLEALLAGPRGGGNASSETVQKMLRGGPFNAWMRSPDLGNRLQ